MDTTRIGSELLPTGTTLGEHLAETDRKEPICFGFIAIDAGI
jgi:hypothetical protein